MPLMKYGLLIIVQLQLRATKLMRESGNGGVYFIDGGILAYNTGTTTQLFGQHNAYCGRVGFPFENQIMILTTETEELEGIIQQ
jgi:predicted sulfurtransferase